MNTIKSPQDNIEAYLYNEINIELYEEEMFDEPERLVFFNLLFKEFEFFCENKTNYLSIRNHFKGYFTCYISDELTDDELEKEREKYSDLQLHYSYLDRLIEDKYPKKTRTGILLKTCEYIERINNDVTDLFMKGIERIDDFNSLRDSIETLSNEEKLIKLVEFKFNYLVQPYNYKKTFGESFDIRCELEIQKINELMKYETTRPNKIDTKTTPTETAPENSLKWQGSDLHFSELIKALFETKLISPEITQKEFFKRMKQFFNVKEFDDKEKLKGIRGRSKDLTPFINVLETSLNNWIKNKD